MKDKKPRKNAERAEWNSDWGEGNPDYPPASRSGAIVFSVVVFALAFLLTMFVFQYASGGIGLLAICAAVLAGWLASSAFHITMSWERVCVMRMGKFRRIAGPGLVCTLPVIDQIAMRVDQRIISTPFYAEKTLTSDLVPVDVDAILLWMVWDPKKACLEVGDYAKTVSFVAQTAMREAIGRASIARVALQRNQIDKELEQAISEEVSEWGVDIIAVKIRDIVIPESLQDAMSVEAQAERQKEARLVLADVERDISGIMADAAKAYDGSDTALRLRTLCLLNETVKQSNGTVVTVPSSFSDGFADASPEKIAQMLGGKE